MPLTKEFARRFAEDWIASWNSHDLARILSHYTEDFEMSSPIGASSLVIRYRGPRGPSAEVFWFDAQNKVCRAAAHYTG